MKFRDAIRLRNKMYTCYNCCQSRELVKLSNFLQNTFKFPNLPPGTVPKLEWHTDTREKAVMEQSI